MSGPRFRIEPAGAADLAQIRGNLERFWFGAPPVALHHPMFVCEFGDTAYVARKDDGEIIGYLFGFVTPGRVGYVHLVAVRDDSRGQGVGRGLYEAFISAARARGAVKLKAIANPANDATASLHRRLGFDGARIDDYGGGGAARIVFQRDLEDPARAT
ncbi:MAG: GNAT family N-acetyltransferase [Candidatus Dormiibacterota bacterium]